MWWAGLGKRQGARRARERAEGLLVGCGWAVLGVRGAGPTPEPRATTGCSNGSNASPADSATPKTHGAGYGSSGFTTVRLPG